MKIVLRIKDALPDWYVCDVLGWALFENCDHGSLQASGKPSPRQAPPLLKCQRWLLIVDQVEVKLILELLEPSVLVGFQALTSYQRTL